MDNTEELTIASACLRLSFTFTEDLIKSMLEKTLNLTHIFIQCPECRHDMKNLANIFNILKDYGQGVYSR